MPNFRIFGPLTIAKQPPVGITIAKSQRYVVNNASQVLRNNAPEFGLIGTLINFWQPKPHHLGVTMNKQHSLSHPHAFNNTHPLNLKPHAYFLPNWSYDKLLIPKITSCRCGFIQTTPTHG